MDSIYGLAVVFAIGGFILRCIIGAGEAVVNKVKEEDKK